MDNAQRNDSAIRDVLPVFSIAESQPTRPREFCGSGFVMGGVFVTCWHCVSKELPDGELYAAAILAEDDQSYYFKGLRDISRDTAGGDLATARIDHEGTFCFEIADHAVNYGTDVWTFGYPLTDCLAKPGGGSQFRIHPRYLEGYVMRAFYYDHPFDGRVMSYELDMPAPEGISGAPLVQAGSRQVIGVVYGTNDVALVDQAAEVEPDTGKRTPEIQRIVTFGLAHYTENLWNLRGAATEGKTLREVVTRS